MISVQRLAETVHRSVLAEMSLRRAEMAAAPMPALNGIQRNPAIIADNWVQDTAAKLHAARHHRAYDEDTIRDYAESYAVIAARVRDFDRLKAFALHIGIGADQFAVKGRSRAGVVARLEDPQWWRRQLRKIWTRSSDDTLREIGIVRKGKQPYVSDAAVEHRAARALRTAQWLESHAMVNGEGEQLGLLELHKRSLANPALRRGEFMCRIRGFQELADSLEHVALFFTLTTPSRFHAQRSGGGINPAWEAERAGVRDGQQWLCATWQRARAKLARLSVLCYGVRVAEPHHDGTPHWHALLFVPKHDAQRLEFVLRQYWMKDAGDEPGAAQHRIKCVDIDRSKGSAVGYVAKYISKNIDAAGAIGEAESDETGGKVSEAAQRVAAWASVHGIRQFQQLGGPPVGLWREARRIREPVEPALIESVRSAADGGQWAGFVGALGGIHRARRRVSSVTSTYRRKLRPPMIRVYRAAKRQPKHGLWTRLAWTRRPALPQEMPAAWMDRAEARATDVAGRDVLASTRYGEQPAARAAGMCSFGLLGRFQSINTRPHHWRIQRIHTGAVMNPPASAARGAEAGNRIHAHRAARGVPVAPPAGSVGHAAAGGFASGSRSGSPLGPVAITVRPQGPDRSAGMDLSWVMTVPYRGRAGPS